METCQLLGEKITPGGKGILQFYFQCLSTKVLWCLVSIAIPTNATISYSQSIV